MNKDKSQDNVEGESEGAAADEYDPHYEPIVPLPAKIVVTTGEEDEVSPSCIENTNLFYVIPIILIYLNDK